MKNILMIVADCARSEKTILDIPDGNPWTRRNAPLPFIELLRTEGQTWTGLHSVSSTTTPNFASMFTGRIPTSHGIQEHSRYSLLPDVATVAQVLSEHGYHTYAEMTGPLIPEAGLNRGFHHYRWRDRSEYLHKGFTEYLVDFFLSLQEPWFLCLHFWEAHQPYQNPEPFNTPNNGLTPYDQSLSFLDHYLFQIFGSVSFVDTSLIYCGDHGERIVQDYELNHALGGEDFGILEAYQQYVQDHQDFDFDIWFQYLSSRFDEITARIYAHNVLGHGFHLTEDLVRVPLIIVDKDRLPGGTVRGELRSQTDLSATILDLAGLWDGTKGILPGISLLENVKHDWIYLEANGSGGKQHSSRCYLRGAKNHRWKYWEIEAEGLEHQVLWDLDNDSRETTNVAAAYPEVCEQAAEFIGEALRERASLQVDLNSPEAAMLEDRLRALGYL